jgi:hypothetical protein
MLFAWWWAMMSVTCVIIYTVRHVPPEQSATFTYDVSLFRVVVPPCSAVPPSPLPPIIPWYKMSHLLHDALHCTKMHLTCMSMQHLRHDASHEVIVRPPGATKHLTCAMINSPTPWCIAPTSWCISPVPWYKSPVLWCI